MNQTFETQWEQCLQIIRDNLQNEEAYQAFFAPNRALSFENGKLALLIPSHYVYEHLEDQYLDLLSRTLQRVFGPGTQLEYKIPVVKSNTTEEETGTSIKLEANKRSETPAEPEFDTHLNPNLTFESFCPGKSNELAYSAGMTVAHKPGRNAFNPFFIFGASGVGKTHLAQAIALKIQELFPGKRTLYITAHLFQVQYTDSIRRNLFNDFINFYQSIDVLVIDDIQEFANKNHTGTQNAFFQIFDYLHVSGKQLIMTCDRPPVELGELMPRLITRFKWGFIGEIEHPDYDLRRQILKGKCQKEGLTIGEDIIDFIARNATDNVRDLEGIINSLLAHSIAFNRPIDQDLTARVMRMIVKIEQRVITCENVLQLVTNTFGIDMKSINSKSRKREIVLARQAAMHLCKEYTTQSISRIGMIVGGRDHATVLHAIKNVQALLQTDKEFKSKYEAVEDQLKAN